MPRPVGALRVGEPLVAALGLGAETREIESHRRFDVVPRIGVTARVPEDHAVGELPFGDGLGGPVHLRRGDDVVDARDLGHRVASTRSRPRSGRRERVIGLVA